MIQFNLLPDVKKEYIKTRRTKRFIMTGSLVVSVSAIAVTLVLFGLVQGSQRRHIDNLTADIDSSFKELKSVEDLDEILTVQNQLTTLTSLHELKPETSRLFDYMTQLTPSRATISSLTIDMVSMTISIAGRADSLATVNQFADTLKFSSYTVQDEEGEPITPFTDVVTRLNRDNQGATYTVDLAFDPAIFDNTKAIVLNVPNIVSTRSTTNKPGEPVPLTQDIFDDTPEAVEEDDQ